MADNLKKEILLKVNRYKRSNNLALALDLCSNPIYDNDVSIQHQKMELLCMQKRYQEAVQIGERPDFIDEMSIQLKLIEAYMGIKEYEKAKDICLRPEFVNHQGFAQKYERIKKDLFRINGTKVKVTSNNFQDYIKEVERLIKEANNSKNPQKKRQLLWKAQGYCTNKAFKNDAEAALYLIKILIMLNDYDQAWQIINDERYIDNIDFFLQKVIFLTNLKKYDEAILLIDNSIFKDDPQVINRRQSIILSKEKDKSKNTAKNAKEKLQGTKEVSLNDILNYIENKRKPLEIIESLPISSLLKDVFTLAYYEVHNENANFQQYLIDMGIRYQGNDECLKVIEELEQHFDNKKANYSRELYQKILIISQNIMVSNSR